MDGIIRFFEAPSAIQTAVLLFVFILGYFKLRSDLGKDMEKLNVRLSLIEERMAVNHKSVESLETETRRWQLIAEQHLADLRIQLAKLQARRS